MPPITAATIASGVIPRGRDWGNSSRGVVVDSEGAARDELHAGGSLAGDDSALASSTRSYPWWMPMSMGRCSAHAARRR